MGSLLPYGPAIAEHVVLSAGLAPERVVVPGPGGGLSEGEAQALLAAVQQLEAWFASLDEREPEGFISLGSGDTIRLRIDGVMMVGGGGCAGGGAQ